MRSLLIFVGSLLASFAPASAQQFGPWYALGRFSAPFDKGSTAAPLAPEKLLKQFATPDAELDFAATFDAGNKETVAWKKLSGAFATPTLDCGVLDLNQICPPPVSRKDQFSNAVCYLYRRIDASEPMELATTLGSDDGVRVWLNAALLVDNHVARGLAVQDDHVTLKLRPGANHLFVKVTNLDGAYSFQIRPWSRVPQSAINDAIDRGVRFLIDRQLLDGSWGVWHDWGGGHAAFTAYTLLKCGVGRDHPAVRMALEFTRQRPMDSVYALSCLILALEASGDASSVERLRGALDELVAMQTNSGLFDYPIYPGGARPAVDMSNTLYAALALRAAHKAGVDVPDAVWSKLAGGALKCFEKPYSVTGLDGQKREVAGFSYRINEGVSGSMTSAGVSVLAICDEVAGERLNPGLRQRMADARDAGLEWLAIHLDWSNNPGQGPGHLYFWIYGIERVGGLLGIDKIGPVDWSWSGAEYLLKAQAAEGYWNQGYAHHEYLDTLLALLFLKKATARGSGETSKVGVVETKDTKADVLLRVTGDTPITVWPTALADDIVARLASESGILDVEKVEYLARRKTDGTTFEAIGATAGAEIKRSELQRFALRHVFDARGAWLVKARVFVRPYVAGDRPAELPAAEMFESPELELRIDGVIDPARLEYAADLNRNLLYGAKAKFASSSQSGDDSRAELSTDGNHRTGWRCSKDDVRPKWSVQLERPLKVDRLLLSQVDPCISNANRARVARVEVLVNQTQKLEATFSDDVLEKLTLDLGAVVALKSLEITVLQARDRVVGSDSVGFSEVELVKQR